MGRLQLEPWRKNLYIIAFAEFLVLVGFSSVNPFIPLFIKQLGTYSTDQAALWSGIAIGSSGMAMFLSAPLWGLAADRWGRKPMLLRSQFGGSIVVALAGLSPNVYYFVVLRASQGLFTGTVPAAAALVSAITPKDRMPFAMGLLMLAVYSGNTLGPLLGGLIASQVGYQATFFVTAVLLFTGGLIVILFVKETFERPAEGKATTLGDIVRLAGSREMLPLLLVMATLYIGPQMVAPVVPLLFSEMSHEAAATAASGLAFALLGLVTATSSFISGRLGRRIDLRQMLVYCLLGSGLLYLPLIWAGSVAQMVILLASTGLFTGGIITASNILVSRTVPEGKQGVAYGLAGSANSLGVGLGPLFGGPLAAVAGLRPVFGVAGGVFILVSFLASRWLKPPGPGD